MDGKWQVELAGVLRENQVGGEEEVAKIVNKKFVIGGIKANIEKIKTLLCFLFVLLFFPFCSNFIKKIMTFYFTIYFNFFNFIFYRDFNKN